MNEKPLVSPNYMEMRADLEGERAIYLRIPTFWDDIKSQWIGAIKTPKTRRIISASGKTSFELQNNFSRAFAKEFEENPEETFAMFKPLEHWEAIYKTGKNQ